MRYVRALLLCALLFQTAYTQRSGEEILMKVAENMRGVDDYVVQLDITVDLERLKVPSMKVKMFFKQPDKVHYESGNFALLPKESMSLNPSQLLERYTVGSTREYSDSGRRYCELLLRPKKENSGLRNLVLTLDSERWVPASLGSQFPDGSAMSARFSHEQIDGHWLTSVVHVMFSSPESGNDDDPPPTPGRRPPRKGSITVRYSDYRLNTGLSDEIFEEKKE